MVNYTAQDKSKIKDNDNYVADLHKSVSGMDVSCWMCIFCGENKELPLFNKKYLCAKYIMEITNVQGAGTCDKARSRFKWYNRLYAKLTFVRNAMLKATGFKFLGR